MDVFFLAVHYLLVLEDAPVFYSLIPRFVHEGETGGGEKRLTEQETNTHSLLHSTSPISIAIFLPNENTCLNDPCVPLSLGEHGCQQMQRLQKTTKANECWGNLPGARSA